MKISSKLFIIVILTILEVSITLWAALELSKGATFHQLNSLHLKYSAVFRAQVYTIEQNGIVDISEIRESIENIKKQPIACLEQVNFLDELIMQSIGTSHAIDLCEKDITDANEILSVLGAFERGEVSEKLLLEQLRISAKTFNTNSAQFEKPITKTVSFVVKTMIPLVIVISLFNIMFITLMSRNISNSIANLIRLLKNNNSELTLNTEINQKVTGELKTLLNVAKDRIEKDIFNIENNKQLKAIVDERTKKLTKANEELSQFAYRTSHDLVSPLASSKSLVKFILQDIDSGNTEEAKANLTKTYTLLEKQEKLIRNILQLTKADINFEATEIVSIPALIAEICERLSEQLTSNNCKLVFDFDADFQVKTERIRVSLILENLISNAAKYCDPNKQFALIKIRLRASAAELLIAIEDNGLGIPSTASKDVFKMFTRLHPDVSFGSGLGMSIVKKHVDVLKGEISYESSEKGTTFTIVLPMECAL